MDVAVLVIRLIVGGLLVGAGITKLFSGHAAVLRSVAGYELLPANMAAAWASALPALELSVGAALVFGLWSGTSALLGAGLLGVITAAVASVLIRGRRTDCGCFPKGFSRQVTWTVVGRNSFLIAALAAVVLRGGGGISLDAIPWVRVWAALFVAAIVLSAVVFTRIRPQEAIT